MMIDGDLGKIKFAALIAVTSLVLVAGIDSYPSLLSSITTPPAEAGETKPEVFSSTPEEAARKGIAELHRLTPTDDEYAKILGFDSAEEAARAQLGSPLQVYMFSLVLLKEFGDKTDIETDLFKGPQSIIYPLVVNATAKSALTVTQIFDAQNQWRITKWGSPKLIRMLEEYRQQESSFVTLISPQNPMNLRFLGERRAGELILTPIANIPRIDIKAGQQLSAREIFTRLIPIANEFKPDAPPRSRGASQQ